MRAQLTLFQSFLGEFDFAEFRAQPRSFSLFNTLLLAAYLVIATLLLASLLIAIISYKYRPEEVAQQSIFGLAEVVDAHQTQLEQHTLCSPFCVLALPFGVLPRGRRRKLPVWRWIKMGLPPMEVRRHGMGEQQHGAPRVMVARQFQRQGKAERHEGAADRPLALCPCTSHARNAGLLPSGARIHVPAHRQGCRAPGESLSIWERRGMG